MCIRPCRRRAVALLLASVLAGAVPAAAAGPKPAGPTKTLAVIPYYGPEKMWQLFSPLVEYLRRETGEPWELKLFPNHRETLAAVCGGKVDVTLLGPVPLGEAYETCGAAPFLVPLGKDGLPAYHSMLVTSDLSVTSVAQLRGKKIGFLRGSTAAHTLPLKMLRDAGLGPGSYEAVFLPSQDKMMTALLDGAITGAGFKEALFRRFEREHLRLLRTSDPVPNFAFAALPSQPPAFREKFVAALTRLRPRERAGDAAVVKAWDDEVRNGFVLPAADFLPAVRRVHQLSRTLAHEDR